MHLKSTSMLFALIGGLLLKHTLGEYAELSIEKMGTFQLANSNGVCLAGKHSLLFLVKACQNAVIALSKDISMTDAEGKYFIFVLASYGKTHEIKESCFICQSSATTIKPKVLNCRMFLPFWIAWDGEGTVRIGEGTVVGDRELLNYTSKEVFPLYYLKFTSLDAENLAKYKVKLDNHLEFVNPEPDGSTVIRIPETAKIGTVLYMLKVGNSKTDLKFQVIGKNADTFGCSGRNLTLLRRLDYERKRSYLVIISTDDGPSVSLTISVMDVRDEVPVITGTKIRRIVEELPIGTRLGGLFKMTDADVEDQHVFTLTGADAHYFNVDKRGDFVVMGRLDADSRDNASSANTLDGAETPPWRNPKLDLTLMVADSSNYRYRKNLSLSLINVNDNPPVFSSQVYTVNVTENMTDDVLLLKLECSDLDSRGPVKFKMRLLDDYDGKFRLSRDVLFAVHHQLDYETTEVDLYNLVVTAEDKPVAEFDNFVRTGTTVVQVQVLPRNEFPPTWNAPVLDESGSFPDIHLAENATVGTVVMAFNARDKDKGAHGTIIYDVRSVVMAKNSTRYFIIDHTNGLLRLAAPLDRDRTTGGIQNFKLIITATDGDTEIEAGMNIVIDDVNDNVPTFSKKYYIVSNPSQDASSGPLLSFDVTDDDVTSNISVSIVSNVTDFYLHKDDSGIWTLKLKEADRNFDWSFPNTIRLLASDGGIPEMTSQADVIFIFSQCEKKEPTTTQQTTQMRTTQTRTTQMTTLRMTTTVAMTSSTHPPTSSTTEPTTEEETTTTRPTTLEAEVPHDDIHTPCDVTLWLAVCIVEGVVIVVIIVIVLLRKFGCIKRSSVDVSSHRTSPLGCETGMRDGRESRGKPHPLSANSGKESNRSGDRTRSSSRNADIERKGTTGLAKTHRQSELGKEPRTKHDQRKGSKEQADFADATEDLNKDLTNIIDGSSVPPMDTKASHVPKPDKAEVEENENETACEDNFEQNNSDAVLYVHENQIRKLPGHKNLDERITEADSGQQESNPRSAEKSRNRDGAGGNKNRRERIGKLNEAKKPGGAIPSTRDQGSRTNLEKADADLHVQQEPIKHTPKGKDIDGKQIHRSKDISDVENRDSKDGSKDHEEKKPSATPMGFFELVMAAKQAKEQDAVGKTDT